MSLARKKRRWQKWWRYCDRLILLNSNLVNAPPGLLKVYDEMIIFECRKRKANK